MITTVSPCAYIRIFTCSIFSGSACEQCHQKSVNPCFYPEGFCLFCCKCVTKVTTCPKPEGRAEAKGSEEASRPKPVKARVEYKEGDKSKEESAESKRIEKENADHEFKIEGPTVSVGVSFFNI